MAVVVAVSFLLLLLVALLILYLLFTSDYRSPDGAKWAYARFVTFGVVFSLITLLNFLVFLRTVHLLKSVGDSKLRVVLLRIRVASFAISILALGALGVLCVVPLQYPVAGFYDNPSCYYDIQAASLRFGRLLSLFLVFAALCSLSVARFRGSRVKPVFLLLFKGFKRSDGRMDESNSSSLPNRNELSRDRTRSKNGPVEDITEPSIQPAANEFGAGSPVREPWLTVETTPSPTTTSGTVTIL